MPTMEEMSKDMDNDFNRAIALLERSKQLLEQIRFEKRILDKRKERLLANVS